MPSSLMPATLRESASLAERLDQLPLAHFRAPGNSLPLRLLVELLAVTVLEPATRPTAALPAARTLLAELAARALREACDRPLFLRRRLRLLHVAFGGLHLLLRRHDRLLSLCQEAFRGSVPANVKCRITPS